VFAFKFPHPYLRALAPRLTSIDRTEFGITLLAPKSICLTDHTTAETANKATISPTTPTAIATIRNRRSCHRLCCRVVSRSEIPSCAHHQLRHPRGSRAMMIAQTATTKAAKAVMVSVGGKAAIVTYFETVSSSCFIKYHDSMHHPSFLTFPSR
jgi:hypothetical protein